MQRVDIHASFGERRGAWEVYKGVGRVERRLSRGPIEDRMHRDNPHAVGTARAVRAVPLQAGEQVSPFTKLAG